MTSEKAAGSTGPRTVLPDARKSPRFAGIPTFCRYPQIDLVPMEHRPVDWALYGVPFDSGVTYRPGARFGPRAIRIESQYIKPYHIEHDLMLTDVLSLADAGDAPVRPFSCKDNLRSVSDFAQQIGEKTHTKLMAVGGDHSIALANIRATWERRSRPSGGLALLHFDSHVDTVDQTLGERFSHASPFIRAIEDGLVDPKRMLSVGIKGPLNTPRDLDYAKSKGVRLLTCEQLRRGGMKMIDEFCAEIGDSECYLTWDIDVIDPAYAPGTGTPSIGGLSAREALGLVRHLAVAFNGGPPNLVGADLVEVLPDRDPTGNTSLLASHIMYEILCLDGLRRRGKSEE